MPRPSRALAALRALCAFLALAACGGEGPGDVPANSATSANTISLARAFLSGGTTLTKGSGVHTTGGRGSGGREVRLEADGVDAWASTELVRADWSPIDGSPAGAGLWRAPLALQGRGKRSGTPPQRLESAEHAFESAPVARLAERGPGSFALDVDSVLLCLEPNAEPPPFARLSVFCERATPSERGWWVRGRLYSGRGLALWPGESTTAPVRVPPDSVLRFATVVEPLLVGKAARDPAVRFRILADGEELFTHTMRAAESAADWHTVDLGQSGGRTRELQLEVSGTLAHAAFLAPVIGPSDPSQNRLSNHGGAGSTAPRAPDIVLFVADTLRADVMSAYGGEHGLTPFLDRLAERGLTFTQARSTSTYTLPSHSSMFTGLFPHQVRVKGTGYALPDEVSTIAELLGAAGYRTGAVTDSVQVSRKYGLDQGFEWFDERAGDLDTTLARAGEFLDADDGRPTFLFVHTYRAHLPYTVTPETRAEHGERLDIRGKLEVLRARVLEAQQRVLSGQEAAEASEDLLRLAGRLRSHYFGGVIDLDRGIERFWNDLDRRGMLDDGYVLFTSDHGEAFFEHDVLYHTGKVWDELVRVPLLLFGPDIEPGTQEHPASLVDLAPTFAALAGLPPQPDWEGRSLFDLDEQRPVFSFECYYHKRPDATLSVVHGSRKVIGYEEPGKIAERGVLAAFDLASDPHEHHDLSHLEDWPAELLDEMAPLFEALLLPAVEESTATLDAAMLEELRAMGYTAD